MTPLVLHTKKAMVQEAGEQLQTFLSPNETPKVSIEDFERQQIQNHDELFRQFLANEITRDQFNQLASKQAVELEKYRRDLEHERAFDPMTGLYRKELLANLLATRVREMARLRKTDAPKPRASVLLLDLDHFGRVNNQFNYAVGDQTISAFGASLLSELRPGDLAGRFGGEEVFILLENADVEAALKAAERYREAVTENIKLFVPEIGPQTVSIGVMEFPDDVFDRDMEREGAERDLLLDLVRRAQEPLKIGGKEAGRNRIGVRRFNPETQSYDIFTAGFTKDDQGRVTNIQYLTAKPS